MKSQSSPEFKIDKNNPPSEAAQSSPASKASTSESNPKPKIDNNKKITQWINEVKSMTKVTNELDSATEKLSIGFFSSSDWKDKVTELRGALDEFNIRNNSLIKDAEGVSLISESQFVNIKEAFSSLLEKANEIVLYNLDKKSSKIHSILQKHFGDIQTKYEKLNNDFIDKDFEANSIQSFIEELKEEKKDTQNTKDQMARTKGKLAILKADKKAFQSFQSNTSSTAGTLSALLSLLPEMVDNNLRIMQAENKSLSLDSVRPQLQSFLNKKTQEMCSMLSGLKQGKPTPYQGDIVSANSISNDNSLASQSLSKIS